MALATYGDLKTAVANWLARADLTSRIPEFVALAEARINRNIAKIAGAELRSTSLTISAETTDLPSDFNSHRSLLLVANSATKPLEYMVPDTLYGTYPSLAVGMPRAYTVQGKDGADGGKQIVVRPLPDGTYTGYLTYHKKVPTLTTGADGAGNWFLTANPDIYLYASLVEATPFLGDDARIQVWAGMLQKAVDDLEEADRDIRWPNLRASPNVRLIGGN